MLTPEEHQRYARHYSLPEIGTKGQEKLKQASVLCIGTGGLGSPAALYLAAAGVGRIGLVDDDQVELSNLQRQILHGESWVGKDKLESAKARLLETNSHVQVECHKTQFSAANALSIASQYDILLDGTDNFPTRYLSNDTAALLKKPNIYGSIFRFEGQISVFAPHLGGPCYRCMLPEPPDPGSVPSCAEAGVLGVLPGIIGSLQAMEAIKLILQLGEPPLGKLVHYDAPSTSFRSFRLRKDPQCPLCGDEPSITELIDYQEFCGFSPASSTNPSATHTMHSISVTELQTLLNTQLDGTLLDVRMLHEVAAAKIESSTHIPLADISARHAELPKDQTLYVYCKGGVRSQKAILQLAELGYTELINVTGGIDAWREEIDPSLPPA